MLSRKIVLPVCDRRLVERQRAQWRRAWTTGPERGPKYEYPCWVCGELGEIGVAGFGTKGTLIRPRNFQHADCFESVDEHQKMIWRIRDTKHVLRRAQRRKSKRSYDREALRQRRYDLGLDTSTGKQRKAR